MLSLIGSTVIVIVLVVVWFWLSRDTAHDGR
jgi:hypothetical protein